MAKYKILAPNKSYTGVSASVSFCNGVGYTENKRLVDWFIDKGYKVIDEDEVKSTLINKNKQNQQRVDQLEEMTIEELMLYSEEVGVDIGKATTKEGILKKLKEAEEVNKYEICR